MKRYTCPIKPVHADGGVCVHKIKPSGRSEDPDCPGRAGYTAKCSCGTELGSTLRTILEEDRAMHLHEHRQRPVRTVELPPASDRAGS